MKYSQMAAKVMIRLFLILILIALWPFFTGDTKALDHIYLNTTHPWALAAPILLLISFVILLILCLRAKYQQQDVNWLLVLNIAILIIYGVTVFIRIRQIINA